MATAKPYQLNLPDNLFKQIFSISLVTRLNDSAQLIINHAAGVDLTQAPNIELALKGNTVFKGDIAAIKQTQTVYQTALYFKLNSNQQIFFSGGSLQTLLNTLLKVYKIDGKFDDQFQDSVSGFSITNQLDLKQILENIGSSYAVFFVDDSANNKLYFRRYFNLKEKAKEVALDNLILSSIKFRSNENYSFGEVRNVGFNSSGQTGISNKCTLKEAIGQLTPLSQSLQDSWRTQTPRKDVSDFILVDSEKLNPAHSFAATLYGQEKIAFQSQDIITWPGELFDIPHTPHQPSTAKGVFLTHQVELTATMGQLHVNTTGQRI